MLNLNETILQGVVDRALESAKNEPKWVNAIKKAHQTLLENPYIEVVDDHTLIIAGNTGVYTSNGVCQCTAYKNGIPCYHRAASRLWTRYNEALKVTEQANIQEQRSGLVQRIAAARKSYAEAMRDMDELFDK